MQSSRRNLAPIVSDCFGRARAALVICGLLIGMSGCKTWRVHRTVDPRVAFPSTPVVVPADAAAGPTVHGFYATAYSSPVPGGGANCGIDVAGLEDLFAVAKRQAVFGSAECVDQFYQVATGCWQRLACSPLPGGDPQSAKVWRLYHAALERLIVTGSRFHRLDPSCRLLVNTPHGQLVVPVTYIGFAWQPQDFSELLLAENYKTGSLVHIYRSDGLGVPLVVIRRRQCEERFHAKEQYFATTAVLRSNTGSASGFCLELHDPLRVSTVDLCGRQAPLAADFSAPLAMQLAERPRLARLGFLHPGNSKAKAKLILTEPYQPGKIPIVFIHGLLSDPLTWADLANELRVRPGIAGRYQLWGFQYATGRPFLGAAASLREELAAAVATLDPDGRDPALSQIVLVGHSMGGLLAKLQVVDSGTALWDSVSNRPLESISATPETRYRLCRAFFFSAQPRVRRVVFIGTPHGGSSWATRSVGRLGAALVESDDDGPAYRQLLRANPGVFHPSVNSGMPTSVDFLEPDNPVLVTMRRLPPAPGVCLHSIIGTGRTMLFGGPADGFVPVASAQLPGVASERLVDAEHSDLHKHPDAVQELYAILLQGT